jgi:S1-C subfamily serine protease
MATEVRSPLTPLLSTVALLLLLIQTTPGLAAQRGTGEDRLAQVEPADHEAVVVAARASLVRVVAVRPLGTPPSGESVIGSFRPRARVASGVVIDSQGHLLTSARTVYGASELVVRTPEGREVPGELLGLDGHTGLALVRIPPNLVRPIAMAPQSSLAQGSTVITMGHTYGSVPSQDVGQITWYYEDPLRSLIQMTNSILPGHSGGAVIDSQGRLAGVIIGELATDLQTGDTLREASSRGSSFAIPVTVLPALVRELKEHGRVRRGYLGVRIVQGQIIDPARPDEPFEVGVSVTEVLQGGPAWNAGLRAGDLVVAVDDEPVNSPDELLRLVAGQSSGSSAKFVWVRGDVRHEAQVQLGVTPDSLHLASLQEPSNRPPVGYEQVRRRLEQLGREMDSVGVRRIPAR